MQHAGSTGQQHTIRPCWQCWVASHHAACRECWAAAQHAVFREGWAAADNVESQSQSYGGQHIM
eukprot:366162-Chlamydomonas_euryale.AAC.9